MVAGEGAWRAADRHQRRLPADVRKRRGVWFTPPELSGPTAARALAPLDDGRPLRVCDPAVGAGAFLLAAQQALTWSAAELGGVDVAPAAIAIAKAALPGCDLRVADGLRELPDESFDAVLTNPPWETLQDGADTKAQLRELRGRFERQGADKLYTYRLFVERAVRLLRPGGRLGMVVPASLWFDRDAASLRDLLLDECDWQWLFGFENRARVFDIDSRYRFGVVIATKGARTKHVRVAFGRTDPTEWSAESPAHTSYRCCELRALSPRSGAFVEVEGRRDLEILTRIQASGRPLTGSAGALHWRQGDYNMTSDRPRFMLRAQAEEQGYRADEQGVWRARGRPALLALRQGAMIHDLDGNAGAHDRGVGHKTRWRRPTGPDELRPLYLVDADEWAAGAQARGPARIALRALSNATNARTAIACLLPDVPCGNSLGVLWTPEGHEQPVRELAACAAALASLPFDWSLRMRLAGTNLNRFVLEDCVLPRLDAAARDELARAALRLCAIAPWTEPLWRAAQAEGWCADAAPATAPQRRRALQTRIDVLVGEAFELTRDDVAWITRGPPFAKGFWRVARDLSEPLRRPHRWLEALAR